MRWTLFSILLSSLALVGYARTLNDIDDYLARDYVSWPGGVENSFNTYVFGLNSLRNNDISYQFGATYIGLIERLPPGVLGLDQPPRSYDILAGLTRLIGGEYFLTEPILNGGMIGALLWIHLLCFGFNYAVRAIARVARGEAVTKASLMGTVVLMMSFRTLWYPMEHTFKTLVVIALGVGSIEFVSRIGRSHLNAAPLLPSTTYSRR